LIKTLLLHFRLCVALVIEKSENEVAARLDITSFDGILILLMSWETDTRSRNLAWTFKLLWKRRKEGTAASTKRTATTSTTVGAAKATAPTSSSQAAKRPTGNG
jgi:hypothetical protein